MPLGSGLSSSASLECAVALAMSDLHDLALPGRRLAELAQRAENDAVGAPTGPMDQRASVLCTAGHALLLDTRAMSTEQVPLDPAAAGLALLVVDPGCTTSTRAASTAPDGAPASRRRRARRTRPAGRSVDDLDSALARLSDDVLRRRVRHVVTEDVPGPATPSRGCAPATGMPSAPR